jgi:hypothetical protein
VRKWLESQYPGVTFDWKTYESTPMPPPEPEYWRERRRAERAARQARQLEESEAQVQETEVQEPDTPGDISAGEGGAPEFPLRVRHGDVEVSRDQAAAAPEGPPVSSGGPGAGVAGPAAGAGDQPFLREKRRRRRGGRRRHAHLSTRPTDTVPHPVAPETASEDLDEAAGDNQGSPESEPE